MPLRYRIKDCAKKDDLRHLVTEFGVIRTAISHGQGERLNGGRKAQMLAHT